MNLCKGTTLAQQLPALAKLNLDSPYLHREVLKTLLLAFSEPKPLFPPEHKAVAAAQLESSILLLRQGFCRINVSMLVDKREYAQCLRSGLQYLVDEFIDDSEVYSKLQTKLIQSGPIQWMEEWIEITVDSEPDYPDHVFRVKPEEREQIPQSHSWWNWQSRGSDSDSSE